MLTGLFGRKSDHPMAEMKSAQALLAELPRNDPRKMLMELTEWMESVGTHEGFRPEHQYAVLNLLDETAQSPLRRLSREYFAPHELERIQESRLWLLLGNWSLHAADAYLGLFERCRNGDQGGLKASMPLLAVRAVHVLTERLKYLSAHYGPTEPALWGRIAAVYRYAESTQSLDQPVELYPGVNAGTTVRAELVRLLGWHGCGISSLSPLFMHLTERIVARYADSLTLGPQQSSDSLFSFDLASPSAPLRVKASPGLQASTRFIGMTGLRPRLEGLLGELAKNSVPQELGLNGDYPPEAVRAAAQYLLDYLNDPPLRRSPRRNFQVGLTVANGFDTLIASARSEGGEDARLEHWEIEDISASGFRTVLMPPRGEGIRIGSLIGIQPDGVAHWGAAVVRRLMRDDAHCLHVGAEMLAPRLAGVELEGALHGEGRYALWLQAKSAEPDGEARLLMQADTFSMLRSLPIRLAGKNYLLLPIELDEKGRDYDLARFRVIEQEAAED